MKSHPTRWEKKEPRKEDPSMNQKNKIQSGSQQITKTNYVSKPPTNPKTHI